MTQANTSAQAAQEAFSWMIDLHQVVKRYQSMSGVITALQGIDLQVSPGEFIVVTGKSGSGKTTLVNMIAALDRADSGDLWVAGTALHTLSAEKSSSWRGQTVGVVFQRFELMTSLTLMQNVIMPMDFSGQYSPDQRRRRAMMLLLQMDIADHAHKRPQQISGGQQQRVAIARALANDPKIIIADEPTGSLDSNTSKHVIDIFKSLNEQGKTIVLVTHDRDIARAAKRAITLADGMIVDDRR